MTQATHNNTDRFNLQSTGCPDSRLRSHCGKVTKVSPSGLPDEENGPVWRSFQSRPKAVQKPPGDIPGGLSPIMKARWGSESGARRRMMLQPDFKQFSRL